MHIEIGIISPEKLAYAGVAATALLGAHTMGLLKSPTAWLRTALAAFFFSVLMQAWHLPVGPSELHLVGADRKSTRLNSSHSRASRMPSSA